MKGWFFEFVCPGYSLSTKHEGMLLLKNATVNRNLGFNDVCKEKHVKIGYSNRQGPGGMFVSDKTGEMIKYMLVPTLKGSKNVAYQWELEEMFFIKNNIKPEWIQFSTNDWGYLNETTGQWSGAVGLIQRDEADYAISEFSAFYARGKVVAFSPTSFKPRYWATTRRRKSPIWNRETKIRGPEKLTHWEAQSPQKNKL